jgi:uncharacterized membrane protein
LPGLGFAITLVAFVALAFMATVFIPTAPNPTTGLIVAVPSDRVRDCDMIMEETTKMLFSGGLVTPVRAIGIHPGPVAQG